MNKLILIIMMLAAPNVYAGDVLNKLKKVPANEYQIVMVYLELSAYAGTKELKGKKVNNLEMTFKEVSIEHERESVFVQFSATAQAKDLTNEKCNAFKGFLTKIDIMGNLVSEIDQKIWNNSSNNTLKDDILLKVKLISEENENLSITCQ